MVNENMREEIEQQIEKLFILQEWSNYEFDEGIHTYRISFKMQSRIKSITVFLTATPHGVEMHIILPFGLDEDNQSEVLKFIAQVNIIFSHGAFKVNTHYKTIEFAYNLLTETVPSTEFLNDVLSSLVEYVDNFGDELMSVAFGVRTADEAVKSCFEKLD